MSRKKRFLNYESQHQPLVSRGRFAQRLLRNFLFAQLFIGISLFGGMLGYHYLEDMPWIDAFANAAMILSGMGPLAPMQTWNGKLFAGLYALYSGLAVVLAVGLIIAPIFHRVLHRFHVASEDEDDHPQRRTHGR
jgi:hypothetical protein